MYTRLNGEELLVYDFSLEIGDSLNLEYLGEEYIYLDISGYLIRSMPINDKSAQIDLDQLPVGMYFVHANLESNYYFIDKFIKI